MSFTETKITTTDGTELRAQVYSTAQLGPGAVLCPGFNCVLSMLNLPACAAGLQRENVTVLLYEPRGVGSSGGSPRNDIDPPQYVADMSDALTHLLGLPTVDLDRAGLTGFSLGGSVALTAASVDPRCRFVIAAAPLTDLDFTSPAQRARVLRRCAADRESQALGNAPATVRMINDSGENAAGLGHGFDTERYARLVRRGREIAPGHVNRLTLMSYYKLAMWTPWPLWKHLGTGGSACNARSGLRGALFVVPGQDTMSYTRVQQRFYDELDGGPGFYKAKVEITDAGHEGLFTSENLPKVVTGISRFIDSLNTPPMISSL